MESKQTVKLLLLFTFLLSIIPIVYATEGEVNLTDFPQKLSEMLNIDLFPAQLLTTGIFMSLFLFPTLLLTRNVLAPLIMGLIVMGFCIAMGWLPYWFLLVLAMMVALMFAGIMRGWITGGPSKGD